MTTKPPTSLPEIHADEVTLCKWGKNNKARFPLWKQAEEEMDEFEKIIKSVLETEIDEEADLDEYIAKAKLDEKQTAALKTALRMLSGFKDMLPKDALDKLGALAGYPAPAEKACDTPEEKDMEKKVEKSVEEITVEKDAPAESEKFEALQKAHNEEIAALRKSHDELASELKKEKDARALAGWRDKVVADAAHFPGKSVDEMAELLKSLEDVDPKLAESQFESMKVASKAMAESALLKAKGSAFGADSPESAWARIEKTASEIVQKSSDSDLTHEAAIALVCERNPGLYAEYEAEEKAKRRS